MSGQGEVSEAALTVSSALAENAKRQLGGQTPTELMRRTGLTRCEVNAGLRELATAQWAVRRIAETPDRQLSEQWIAGPGPDRRASGRDQVAAE
jgi:hypothetical protein